VFLDLVDVEGVAFSVGAVITHGSFGAVRLAAVHTIRTCTRIFMYSTQEVAMLCLSLSLSRMHSLLSLTLFLTFPLPLSLSCSLSLALSLALPLLLSRSLPPSLPQSLPHPLSGILERFSGNIFLLFCTYIVYL